MYEQLNPIFTSICEIPAIARGKAMRIERRDRSFDRNRWLGSEIAEAAACTGVEGRVCGDRCTRQCSQCGSLACQCECSPDCPDAPRALSVDPDQHPIEPAITPRVISTVAMTPRRVLPRSDSIEALKTEISPFLTDQTCERVADLASSLCRTPDPDRRRTNARIGGVRERILAPAA